MHKGLDMIQNEDRDREGEGREVNSILEDKHLKKVEIIKDNRKVSTKPRQHTFQGKTKQNDINLWKKI